MTLAALALAAMLAAVPTTADGPPEATVDAVAGIVAGETAVNCPACDRVIACTIARDLARGYSVARLRHRWYGHGWPSVGQRETVRQALSNGGYCAEIPDCRFVGNVSDYANNWRGLGPGVLHCGTRGCVVCVPWARRAPQVTEWGRRGAR
jgi:hypothetical protein